MVAQKKGETRERGGENVVDLMDALKKSLGQQSQGSRRAAKRASGRRKAGAA